MPVDHLWPGIGAIAPLAVALQPPVRTVAESTTVFLHITNPSHGSHIQEWIDGVLKAWYPADADSRADLDVARPAGVELDVAYGRVMSAARFAEATLLTVGDGITVTYPPLIPQWAPSALDSGSFEFAPIVVQLELNDHPFGPLPLAYEFGSTCLERCGFYRAEHPDITFRCGTRDAVRYTLGRYSMYEFLSRAQLEGDLFKLTVATALFDNPVLRRASTAIYRDLCLYESYLRCVVVNDWDEWGAVLRRYVTKPVPGSRGTVHDRSRAEHERPSGAVDELDT